MGTEGKNIQQESQEYLEKREGIKTVLHDFYQERQKNTPEHKKMAELIDEMRSVSEKLIPYVKASRPDWKNVGLNEEGGWGNDLVIKIRIVGISSNDNGKYSIPNIVDELNGLKNLKRFKNDKELDELISAYARIEQDIERTTEKIFDLREQTARELTKIIPELNKFQNAKSKRIKYYGLYGSDGYIELENDTTETENGPKTESYNFDTYGSKRLLRSDTDFIKQWKLSEKELTDIKKLEFSSEYEDILKKLRQAIGVYKAEAEGIKQAFLELDDHKILESGAENIKNELMRGKVRFLYEKSGLPKVHKARITQEIMDGTFEFENLCKLKEK